jgi:hypothetical protein
VCQNSSFLVNERMFMQILFSPCFLLLNVFVLIFNRVVITNQIISFYIPCNIAAEWLAFLLYIRHVSGLHLGLESGYPG